MILLCIAVSLFATDIIILKNSTRIDAVIQEVSQSEIKYKKASNPNGPSFILSTSEIVSIVYDNGEVQTFNDNNNQQQSYNNNQQSYNNNQQSYNNPRTSSFVLRDAESWSSFTMNYSYYKPKKDFSGYKTMNGFNVGFLMQNRMYKNLVLLWGLEYQFAMSKDKEDGETDKWMNHNIKVPLRFGFSMPFAKKSSVTVFFGPSFDFNVATIFRWEYYGDYGEHDLVNGKYKYKHDGEKGSESADKIFGFFDVPLGIGVMYKYNHFGIRLQHEWGLVNRSKEDEVEYKADQFTVGLFFSF